MPLERRTGRVSHGTRRRASAGRTGRARFAPDARPAGAANGPVPRPVGRPIFTPSARPSPGAERPWNATEACSSSRTTTRPGKALLRVPRRAGYRVRAAASGAEALAALAAAPADAVLLDLVIPAPDGFEVLRRLRERDAAHAGDRDVGALAGGGRRARDEARRDRLPAEAVRGVRAEPRAAARARRPPRARRTSPPPPRPPREPRRPSRTCSPRRCPVVGDGAGAGARRARSPTPTSRCCSSARAASARTSSRGGSTRRATAPAARS